MRTATSPSTSTIVPPRPASTSGPKAGSWATPDDHLHAVAYLLLDEERRGLPEDAGSASAARIAVTALAAACEVVMPRATPPTSLLWIAAAILTATGPPSSACATAAWRGAVQAGPGGRDAVGGQQLRGGLGAGPAIRKTARTGVGGVAWAGEGEIVARTG